MTADILIPNKSSGIVIDKDITITVNTNGYLIFANPGSGTAGTVYGFKLTSAGAKLIYTVKLSTVSTPRAVGNKESLDELIKKIA